MKTDTYDEAFVKAVDLADRLNRPVELMKNYFGGSSVGLFLLDEKGQPQEKVNGQIVWPNSGHTKAQWRIKQQSHH